MKARSMNGEKRLIVTDALGEPTHNIHSFLVGCLVLDLGKLTHTCVPCWVLKPLPPRNKCTGCFVPTVTDELLKFEEYPTEAQVFMKMTDRF